MNISLVYANPTQPLWLEFEVPEDCTVDEAITASGILERVTDVDFGSLKTGVFGKLAKRDQPLRTGDRVEIYTAAIADPKTVNRRDRD
jgi:putative ubiquitin-RnfH superfamily antitoxin RatB of RatAB toxin-antitoxin module